MGWLKDFFQGKQHRAKENDPFIRRCSEISVEKEVTFDDLVLKRLERFKEVMALSAFGGENESLETIYIEPNVFEVICNLGVYDSFFSAGHVYLEEGRLENALRSFEKAGKIIPWPLVFYALGDINMDLQNNGKAQSYFQKFLNQFKIRDSILESLIPQSTTSRESLKAIVLGKLNSIIPFLGFADIEQMPKVVKAILDQYS